MRLPLSWLKEFLTIDAPVEEICRRLTLAGLEVENVEQILPTFTDVFVAKVKAVERHPNADRLSICEVDAGGAGQFRVVCGAPNVYAGMKAALAKVGARLAGGRHGEGTGRLEDAVPLQAAEIRGVGSEGMLCSELELGMSKDHEGILELAADAAIGEPLANYLQLPDTVLDIAITPNRGDCLSILGLAREIAALFDLRLKPVRGAQLRTGSLSNGHDLAVRVEIQAPELCPHYVALPMTNVKIAPSPMWVRRRLELCGMRALINIVDITNYVMLELGQPLHAFDCSRIADRSIIVRRAGENHEFATLDGAIRHLDPNDLMITDHEKLLAIAGVMGGQNSEVSDTTTSIVLESAYFEPATIARTARRLSIRSEASYRFERGIDRAGQAQSLNRAAELIARLAGGRAATDIVDIQPIPASAKTMVLDLAAISSILGVTLPPATIKKRLKALGAGVESAGKNRLRVTAPSFRPDLNETADFAEEVARLAGLAEIPETLPARTAAIGASDAQRFFERKIREVLIGCGLVEARTIAFIAPEENQRFAGLTSKQAIHVINPLSAELSEMRLSLIPGLLAALRFNLNRESTALHLFEIGKVFESSDRGATEATRLAAISYGDYALGAVGHPAVPAGFSTLKGIVETCLKTFGDPQKIRFETPSPAIPYLHPGRSAIVSFADQELGVLGELHPAEALRLELNSPCALFELDLQSFHSYSTMPRLVVVSPPRLPAVRRDLALVVDRDLPAQTVIDTIVGLHIDLLESAELFDVFEGGSLPSGKKSVAVACLYRGKNRTLTDVEVNREHSNLVEQATVRLGAALRQ
jgi:phenylalanyl-tRNA synthetase beta chain